MIAAACSEQMGAFDALSLLGLFAFAGFVIWLVARDE